MSTNNVTLSKVSGKPIDDIWNCPPPKSVSSGASQTGTVTHLKNSKNVKNAQKPTKTPQKIAKEQEVLKKLIFFGVAVTAGLVATATLFVISVISPGSALAIGAVGISGFSSNIFSVGIAFPGLSASLGVVPSAFVVGGGVSLAAGGVMFLGSKCLPSKKKDEDEDESPDAPVNNNLVNSDNNNDELIQRQKALSLSENSNEDSNKERLDSELIADEALKNAFDNQNPNIELIDPEDSVNASRDSQIILRSDALVKEEEINLNLKPEPNNTAKTNEVKKTSKSNKLSNDKIVKVGISISKRISEKISGTGSNKKLINNVKNVFNEIKGTGIQSHTKMEAEAGSILYQEMGKKEELHVKQFARAEVFNVDREAVIGENFVNYRETYKAPTGIGKSTNEWLKVSDFTEINNKGVKKEKYIYNKAEDEYCKIEFKSKDKIPYGLSSINPQLQEYRKIEPKLQFPLTPCQAARLKNSSCKSDKQINS